MPKKLRASTGEGSRRVPEKVQGKYRRRVRASTEKWWNPGEYRKRVRASTEKGPDEYRRRVQASTGEGSGQVPEKVPGKYRRRVESRRVPEKVRVSTEKV